MRVPQSLVTQLCEAVGVEPKNVSRITLYPSNAVFTVMRRNADGNFYLIDARTGARIARGESKRYHFGGDGALVPSQVPIVASDDLSFPIDRSC